MAVWGFSFPFFFLILIILILHQRALFEGNHFSKAASTTQVTSQTSHNHLAKETRISVKQHQFPQLKDAPPGHCIVLPAACAPPSARWTAYIHPSPPPGKKRSPQPRSCDCCFSSVFVQNKQLHCCCITPREENFTFFTIDKSHRLKAFHFTVILDHHHQQPSHLETLPGTREPRHHHGFIHYPRAHCAPPIHSRPLLGRTRISHRPQRHNDRSQGLRARLRPSRLNQPALHRHNPNQHPPHRRPANVLRRRDPQQIPPRSQPG